MSSRSKNIIDHSIDSFLQGIFQFRRVREQLRGWTSATYMVVNVKPLRLLISPLTMTKITPINTVVYYLLLRLAAKRHIKKRIPAEEARRKTIEERMMGTWETNAADGRK
jgi:hypothetical protein